MHAGRLTRLRSPLATGPRKVSQHRTEGSIEAPLQLHREGPCTRNPCRDQRQPSEDLSEWTPVTSQANIARRREHRHPLAATTARDSHRSFAAGAPAVIRADSTWQRGLELVVEETVPEIRGRWAARRIAAAGALADTIR